MRVEFWDKDTYDKDDVIGTAMVEVGEVMGARNCVHSFDVFKHNKKSGIGILKGEKAMSSNKVIWW